MKGSGGHLRGPHADDGVLAAGGQHGKVRVRRHARHPRIAAAQQVDQRPRRTLPHKDVAIVRSRHHILAARPHQRHLAADANIQPKYELHHEPWTIKIYIITMKKLSLERVKAMSNDVPIPSARPALPHRQV